MANYVLSPAAARRLKEMMRGRMVSGRIDGDASHVVDERGFAHPFTLTYAASAGAVDEQTGEADGAWIIWLPSGCLVVNGEAVDVSVGLTAANNYPSGWYDLTDIFDGTDPDDFDLYLDAVANESGQGQSAAIKFALADDDMTNPVLIARVSGKAVKGIVESAIVVPGLFGRTMTINVYGNWDSGYADPGLHDLATTVVKFLTNDSAETNKTINVPGLKAGTGISITKSGMHYVISLSGGGGGGGQGQDGASGGGGMFEWTPPGEGESTGTIGAGGCMVARKWVSATGTGSGKVDGLYQLKVTLTASGATAEVVSGVSLGTSPNGNVSYIPIYQIASGKISVDYRGAFVVPAYD